MHAGDDAQAAQHPMPRVVGEPKLQVGQPDAVAVAEHLPRASGQTVPVQGRGGVIRHHLHHVARIALLDADVMGGDSVVADSQGVRACPSDRHHGDPERILPVPLRVEFPNERCAV